MSFWIADKLNHAQIEYLFKGIKLIGTNDANVVARLKHDVALLA
jgi:hypothetical protein